MAVDLRKNKDALTKAYQKVVDDNDDTDWLVLGYEGQTPVLKVVETGNGGIEEMSEELSSGKMMYAYCRVKDPNTGLFKYVLIQWTGESVPENLKLKYTTHIRDIQGLLKGIHVTIPANSEEDIDEADILKRVAKSSGANYGFHKEKAKPEEPPAPVGTDYKRIIPTREIDLNNRDKFWSQAEKEELDRQKTEKNRAEAERVQLEQERKEREMKEAKEREQRISQRMKEVNQQKQAEKKAFEINRDAEKKKWEQVQKESSVDEEERGHRSDQLRKERAAEAAAVVSGSTSSARDFFKQKSVERPDAGANRAPPPPRKIRHGFGNQDSSQAAPAARKAPIELPKAEEAEPTPPSKPMRQPEPEPAPEPQQAYIPEPEPEPEPVHEPEPAYEPEPEAVPTSPTSMPQTRDLLRQGLPPRQDSDEEPENDDEAWQEQPAEDFTFREKRVPSYHEDYSAEQHHEETQSHRISSTQHYVEEEETEAPVVSTDQGLRAVALFDYQAADDTEISFDPDDIITNIEQIDEGWWQGFGPDGSYGMFPANYVELC